MDHAEAHELLADLALEPARLGLTDADADAAALRAHVDGCRTCTADVAAWRGAWAAFGDARSSAPPDADAPIGAPAALRARVLAAVAVSGAEPVAAPGGVARDARSRRWPWLAVAAALVLALGAGGLAWVRTGDADHARAEAAQLASVAAAMDRILADPVHWVTPLATADGAPGGTLAWSATEVVVISRALLAPGPGQTYRCWVEQGGGRTPVGAMELAQGTASWAGSMSGWAGLLAPGSRFGVSLVPASGGEGTTVLIGSI